MSSAVNWPPDPIKNAIRSARTFAVYNAPVSIMTMKIGKREIDPSDMKVGERWTSQAIEPAIFWSLELRELVQNDVLVQVTLITIVSVKNVVIQTSTEDGTANYPTGLLEKDQTI